MVFFGELSDGGFVILKIWICRVGIWVSDPDLG
jgi:hypothetical protein